MMAIPGSSTGAAPVAAPPPAAPAALPAVTVATVTLCAVYAPALEVRRNGGSRQIMRRHVGQARLVVTERKERGE